MRVHLIPITLYFTTLVGSFEQETSLILERPNGKILLALVAQKKWKKQ